MNIVDVDEVDSEVNIIIVRIIITNHIVIFKKTMAMDQGEEAQPQKWPIKFSFQNVSIGETELRVEEEDEEGMGEGDKIILEQLREDLQSRLR